MDRPLRTWLTNLGVLTSHPVAFAVAGLYLVAWLIVSPDSFDWHAIVSMATLFMALLIQRAEHRDTQALHAKLDELLKAEGKARNELTQIDKRDAEEIERHRERAQREPSKQRNING
jgi:low affinity Fe/Cu permease